MPFTSVNGVRFHTEVIGNGPPVAMVHGLLVGNLAQWYFTSAPVLAHSQRVLLYDLRGHGSSEQAPGGYDLATMTEDLACLLESFDPRPVSLIGYSYGALIALNYALERPDRVARLVLMDAPLPPARFEEIAQFMALPVHEIAQRVPAPLQPFMRSRRLVRLLRSLDFLVNRTPLLKNVLAEPDVPDEVLARISCDVLCLYGEASPCRPVGERLVRVIPRSKLALIPGGHNFPLEAPELTTARLVEFFHG